MGQFYHIVSLLRRFVNLEMDFVVVTNRQIKEYNQFRLGVQTKTLDVEKVKTIKSDKTGVMKSILDYGDVFVFTDGDTSSDADLAIPYVKKPETVERLLDDIRKE